MEGFNQELCDERHATIQKTLDEVKNQINEIFKGLNWFYVTVIVILLTQLIASTYK